MKKILSIIEGFWPPTVHNTGVSFLWEFNKELVKGGNQVYILTFIEKWADLGYKGWYNKISNKNIIIIPYKIPILINFPKFYFFLIKFFSLIIVPLLNIRYNFDYVIEYSSSPFLSYKSKLFKLFGIKKYIFYLCVNRKGNPSKIITISKSVDLLLTSTKKQYLSISYPNKYYLPISYSKNKDYSTFTNLKINKRRGEKIISYIGLIEERKGIYNFLNTALSLLNKNLNYTFIVVSRAESGNYYSHSKNKKRVLQKINSFPNNFIFFEGTYNLKTLFSKSDICFFPYKSLTGILGYPLSILEAMYNRSIVLCPKFDEIEEFIRDSFNGFLFYPNDLNHAEEKINFILNLNIKEIEKIKDNALKSVLHLDIKNQTRDLLKKLK